MSLDCFVSDEEKVALLWLHPQMLLFSVSNVLVCLIDGGHCFKHFTAVNSSNSPSIPFGNVAFLCIRKLGTGNI